MSQSFRISDALRCLALNNPRGPNLAQPGYGAANNPSRINLGLWKQVVTQQQRLTAAQWDGMRLGGLVSARTGTGRVFEIDHLYLPDTADTWAGNGAHIRESAAPLRLLEQLVELAGSRGGERIFLRLPSGSPLVSAAQQCGFFPHFQETRWEGTAVPLMLNGKRISSLFCVREPQDDYGLFQLFTACTPATVRTGLGLTHAQWQDSQSLWPKARQEWVALMDGKIKGWLALFTGGEALEARLMSTPDLPDLSSLLVELALCRQGPQRWLVPDYQPEVASQLRDIGWRETAQYTMLINRVAVPVESVGMAPVEA